MPTRGYDSRTPSRRHTRSLVRSDLTREAPEKSLTSGHGSKGGRNSNGNITSRFRGGGHKRRYREIDFNRDKLNVPAKVAHIEYDPNRSANIALLHYVDGEKRYILAPVGLKPGTMVVSGSEAPLKPGNARQLGEIPPGMTIHCMELQPGRGGAVARAAGQSCVVRALEGDYALVRMPSGEIRKVHRKCRATLGQVGNLDHMNVNLGKAGRKRYLGKRPHVRGVAMNPVDHPMGGGEGRTSGGGDPMSPTGQLAKGYRTRKKHKPTNKFIIQRRKK